MSRKIPVMSEPSAETQPISVAVVMPAWNAARELATSVPAAVTAAGGREVIVVDAGSTDGSGDTARLHGATVITRPNRVGPAEARNHGVAATNADIDVVLFIDSDCLAHADTVDRVARAFAADPSLVSLTGSYDDTPPDRGFFSQYMNLRHHHTHQNARIADATFWAGCGAVRRDAFLAVDGFDAVRFPRPMIEDIELGLRLRAHGATQLDPELQVTHLKRWTMVSTIRTDIVHRAIPWTDLILEQRDMPNDLNLRASQRIAAAVAPFSLLSIIATPTLAILGSKLWIIGAVIVALALFLNSDILRFFLKKRGVLVTTGVFVFHQIHLVYSAVTFVAVTLHRRLFRRQTGATS